MKSFIMILTVLFSQVAFANSEIKEAIEKTINTNILYLEQENAEGAMSTTHSQSLSYLPTKNALAQLFGNYQLSYEIVSINFIAYDNELAYVRVKQRTKKISGPAFQNNEIDMVQIFKQESGVWKLWSQANMAIKYIN